MTTRSRGVVGRRVIFRNEEWIVSAVGGAMGQWLTLTRATGDSTISLHGVPRKSVEFVRGDFTARS